MRNYLARLGQYTFGLDTAAFQQLQRRSSYKWAAVERIGRKPAHQFTGFGAESISVNGVIYPHWAGGIRQVAAMRAEAGKGLPLPFIYADEQAGQYMGLWCITDIEETRSVLFEDGTPRRIEFRLSIVEYGEDTL